jgi:probable HAF family extracellular repeat protein
MPADTAGAVAPDRPRLREFAMKPFARGIGAACIATVLTTASLAAAAAPSYRLVDLSPYLVDARDVNSSGQVLGEVWDSQFHLQPALYQGGRVTPIDAPFQWQAFSLDDAGNVYGLKTTATGSQLVRYGNGRFTDISPPLPAMPSATDSLAGMSRNGLAAGNRSACGGGCDLHAMLYGPGGERDLGAAGGPSSMALRVNTAGHVVGWTMTPGNDRGFTGFFYADGQMTLMPTLMRDPPQGGVMHSDAQALNERDQVVGWSLTAAPPNGLEQGHAVLWDHGRLIDLGTLGGHNSDAWGINDRGDIIGGADTAPDAGSSAPFLYTHGTMYDVNSLLAPGTPPAWTVVGVGSINDAGMMLGEGVTTSNQQFPLAVLLMPVPEPSTWALMLAGLAALQAARRRDAGRIA